MISESREHVEFVQINELPIQGNDLGNPNPGLRTQVLSGNAQTGCTMLVEASPGWCNPYCVRFASDLEVLILSGDLRINDSVLTRGFYSFVGVGSIINSMSSSSGAIIYWMANGSPQWHTGDVVEKNGGNEFQIIDTSSIPWTDSPAYEGREVDEVVPGLSVRLIRQDPITSAYTLMTRHQPGWVDPRLEAHETWEELLLLQGDYLMGTTGGLTGGSYIFRPPIRPHGPQATVSGAVWFCRGEKEIDFQYHEEAWVENHIGSYQRNCKNMDHNAMQPWGNWWEADHD